MKDPIPQDKIRLLMEETGCDAGEAELALASAGYDLEKAVRTIAGLLRHIVALKGKFQVPTRNLFGVVVVLVDTRRLHLLRVRAVVSYNPALHETTLHQDWYDVERALYAFRLSEGALQQLSQDLEHILGDRWGGADERFLDWIREGEMENIHENAERLISAHLSGETALSLEREELNLDQYRRVRREEFGNAGLPPSAPSSGGSAAENLTLKVELEAAPEGVPAVEVAPGDVVRALLVDERDIAQYLSRLLGGRGNEGLKALPAAVEEVVEEGGVLRFQLRLSGSILGVVRVPRESRVKVDRRGGDSWWRRLLSRRG